MIETTSEEYLSAYARGANNEPPENWSDWDDLTQEQLDNYLEGYKDGRDELA